MYPFVRFMSPEWKGIYGIHCTLVDTGCLQKLKTGLSWIKGNVSQKFTGEKLKLKSITVRMSNFYSNYLNIAFALIGWHHLVFGPDIKSIFCIANERLANKRWYLMDFEMKIGGIQTTTDPRGFYMCTFQFHLYSSDSIVYHCSIVDIMNTPISRINVNVCKWHENKPCMRRIRTEIEAPRIGHYTLLHSCGYAIEAILFSSFFPFFSLMES